MVVSYIEGFEHMDDVMVIVYEVILGDYEDVSAGSGQIKLVQREFNVK